MAVSKKADVVEYLEVFGHVGLRLMGSTGGAGFPFKSSFRRT
jgi:hypothetical protein